jgi:predicted dehydrogenase
MAGKTVRFGLLGAGLVAPFHCKGVQASSNCELAAVADVDQQRAKALAQTFGCKAYGSLDELLSDESIDVISVLTPNHLHHDAVVAAAKAGKHVLVEKPPAMSLRETDDMIAVCGAAGVKLGVVLNCRVRKSVQAIRQALASGRFGAVFQADVYMKWFRSREYYLGDSWRSSRRSGAGVTIQQAFHYIDLLTYLMGDVADVQARMRNIAHPQVELEDTLMAFLNYRSGAQGVVVASTAMWPGIDLRIEVNGENGVAIMVGERMHAWQFKDQRGEDEQIRQLGRAGVGTGATGPADLDFADHQVIIEGMAKAVRENIDPIVTAQSARKTLEVALAMYQSAAAGGIVELPIHDEEQIWK